jgi:S-adenosylmethionine synthetase
MFKTAESVTQGHPDKVCDQIADAIVDEYLRRDKHSQVDVHVLGSHGMMMIAGEVISTADFDVGALAKQVYAQIGYQDDMEMFVNIEPQSEEMKRVVNGVTDNVVINGYATSETRELLPRPLVFAHNIARRLDDLRRADPAFSWLKPDGKVQVVMDGARVSAVTILASHQVSISDRDVKSALLERLLIPIVGEQGVQMFINPIGSFTQAGFRGDSGASGRKVGVDTYGGLIPHGDSPISGKDPLKVNRAGAYMARFVAREIVRAGLASAALVNVVYGIGRAMPLCVTASGVGEKAGGDKKDLTAFVREKYDFRPEAIVERLDLLRPLYLATASYGHFGREGFPWEKTEQ